MRTGPGDGAAVLFHRQSSTTSNIRSVQLVFKFNPPLLALSMSWRPIFSSSAVSESKTAMARRRGGRRSHLKASFGKEPSPGRPRTARTLTHRDLRRSTTPIQTKRYPLHRSTALWSHRSSDATRRPWSKPAQAGNCEETTEPVTIDSQVSILKDRTRPRMQTGHFASPARQPTAGLTRQTR